MSASMPAWAGHLLRYGGAAGAVLVVWFTVAAPLREDFQNFSRGVDTKLENINRSVSGVTAEVKNLNENILVIFRDRLTRLEEWRAFIDKVMDEIRKRIDKLEAK